MRTRVVLLLVFACSLRDGAAFAQPPKKLEASEMPAVHAFNVTLVLGEMQGASTPDNLPLGARKALIDTRDFLPYKSYRLLDTQFIRCCASMQMEQVRGRLRGIDDQLYAFLINVAYPGRRLSIHFSLSESASKGSSPKPSEASGSPVDEARREVDKTQKELADKRKQGFSAAHPQVQELESKLAQQHYRQAQIAREYEENARSATAMAMATSKASVIDSAFSMDVGETVVIGTSSLKGEKALIALLTAVRRPDSLHGEKK